MNKKLVIDLHLDLAWNALFWNRDLTQSVSHIRQTEEREPPQVSADISNGICTVTFPELRRGGVGISLATIMSRIDPRTKRMRDGMRTQEQAIGMGRGHLAYYQIMEKRGFLNGIRSRADLDEAVGTWQNPGDQTPVYYILAMESADPIADPEDVEFWWDAGLRVVGPAHFSDNTYTHGTGTQGGLKPPAQSLFREMQKSGMVLDISHLTDEAVWEAFDIWDGPIMASHCVCRSLVPGQRHLTDEMILELIRRGAIIGLVFCQYFIEPEINWQELPCREEFTPKRTMKDLIPHVEHIGNLAAGSLRNIAIGSDLDGGFGKELAPLDLDTIADLVKFGQILEDFGYSEDEADGILSGNAVRFFRESWA